MVNLNIREEHKMPGVLQEKEKKCAKCGSLNVKKDPGRQSRGHGTNWWFTPLICTDCDHKFEIGEEIVHRGN